VFSALPALEIANRLKQLQLVNDPGVEPLTMQKDHSQLVPRISASWFKNLGQLVIDAGS